jgi:hypothetical protein
MIIDKSIAETPLEVKPDWKSYQRRDGSLLVRLLKALYGTVGAGRLWYEKVRSILEADGYSVNPVPSAS